MVTVDSLRFIGICGILLIFGIVYAILIARKPFPPKWTWVSVTIGVGITCFGIGEILWIFTGNYFLTFVPIIGFALTGGPMIVGQITKHILQNGGVVIIEEDEIGD